MTTSPPTATVVHIPSFEKSPDGPSTWIEKALGVCGGEARVRRLRIPVWSLVEARRAGYSDEELVRNLALLTPADLAAAWEYHECNQEEIEEAISRQHRAMIRVHKS